MSLWTSIRADRRKLAALVAAPLIVAAGAGIAFLSVSGEPAPSPTPLPTATPSPTPSPTPRPTASPSPTPSPTPEPTLAGLEDGRLTVLVLGSDSSVERRRRGKAPLTDAITVVSVAADGSNVALVSLPRDSTDFPMPDGSLWRTKVNAIVALRDVETMKAAMEGVFGIQIDHYLLIDMDDFSKIVDAVGGLTVEVPGVTADNRCTISAGTQHLDGNLALCYARNRLTGSDYARAGRHQQLLVALRDRLLAGDVDLAALAGSLGSLQTDIQLTDLPQYFDLLRDSADAEVRRLVLAPPTYTTYVGTTADRGFISIPNIDAIHAAVADMVDQ